MNRFFCLQAKSRRLQIYTALRAISRLFSAIMQCGSRLNAKTRTQTLYQYLSPLVVRSTGLEPVRLPTRPSNVRVCQFRHDRANNGYYTLYAMFCQHQSCKFCSYALYFSGNGRIRSRALENLRSLCISGQSFIDGRQGVSSIAASEIDKISLPSDSGTRRTAKNKDCKSWRRRSQLCNPH